MKIDKLLFATKFDELQLDALHSLLDLKQANLNHVVFLNVIDRDKVAMRRGTGYKKDEAIRLKEKANIRFIDWAEHLLEQGMEVGVYIVVGGMARHVIDSAKKEEVDLIVIGPQKKKAFEKLYAGSDVVEIIHGTRLPLLIFKYMDKDADGTYEPDPDPWNHTEEPFEWGVFELLVKNEAGQFVPTIYAVFAPALPAQQYVDPVNRLDFSDIVKNDRILEK